MPYYIFYKLLNMVIILGKHTFFNAETSSLWMQHQLLHNVALVVKREERINIMSPSPKLTNDSSNSYSEVASRCFLVPHLVENLWTHP